MAKGKGNWIKDAIDPANKGKLHRALGVKPGQPIPKGKLVSAAKKGGALGARARLAMTLSTFNKAKGKGKGPAKKK